MSDMTELASNIQDALDVLMLSDLVRLSKLHAKIHEQAMGRTFRMFEPKIIYVDSQVATKSNKSEE